MLPCWRKGVNSTGRVSRLRTRQDSMTLDRKSWGSDSGSDEAPAGRLGRGSLSMKPSLVVPFLHHPASPRRWAGAGLLALVCGLLGLALQPAAAQSGTAASIPGTVADSSTGQPVTGGQVSVPDLGLSTTTGASGTFAWTSLSGSQ